jgi:hypothetical protein
MILMAVQLAVVVVATAVRVLPLLSVEQSQLMLVVALVLAELLEVRAVLAVAVMAVLAHQPCRQQVL